MRLLPSFIKRIIGSVKHALLVVCLAMAAIAIVVGAAYGARLYLGAQSHAGPQTVQCKQVGVQLSVTITSGNPIPKDTSAKVCDRLTITNEDDRLRLIAFGSHDDHQPYDGVTEKILAQGQSLTVTLNQRGTYEFHDHLDPAVIGYFTVTD